MIRYLHARIRSINPESLSTGLSKTYFGEISLTIQTLSYHSRKRIVNDAGKSLAIVLTQYGNRDLGQHGSCKGLLPDGTKSLHEPMLTDHQ